MGARPYDPATGRFLAVDPVDGGSANNYDYAAQDPVNSYDLDGTFIVPGGKWVRGGLNLIGLLGNLNPPNPAPDAVKPPSKPDPPRPPIAGAPPGSGSEPPASGDKPVIVIEDGQVIVKPPSGSGGTNDGGKGETHGGKGSNGDKEKSSKSVVIGSPGRARWIGLFF